MRRTIAYLLMLSTVFAVTSFADGRHRENSHCNQDPEVVQPWEKVDGKSYGEWVANWWQWALSRPLEVNPIEDPDGSFQAARQRGNVWFLGGTSGGSAERTVTVPKGKAILFPVLASVWVTLEDYGDERFDVPGAEANARAGCGMDPCAELEVIIDDLDLGSTYYANLWNGEDPDGNALPLGGYVENDLHVYRAISPVFPVRMPESNWFDQWLPVDGGVFRDCVADGYWVMVKGLCKGDHTIYFKGIDTRNGFEVEVTYHLTVE